MKVTETKIIFVVVSNLARAKKETEKKEEDINERIASLLFNARATATHHLVVVDISSGHFRQFIHTQFISQVYYQRDVDKLGNFSLSIAAICYFLFG